MNQGLVVSKSLSRMGWNDIFIILSDETSSLFYYFLMNDQSLFKNTIMMMTKREDNIFASIIWIHWMKIIVGDHFSIILTELDYITNFTSPRIDQKVGALAHNQFLRLFGELDQFEPSSTQKCFIQCPLALVERGGECEPL